MCILCFPGLTLKAAINALHSVCHKWHIIGVQLEVPSFQLKSIERKSSDSMDQFCDTLNYWMNKVSSPTWRHLVDALKAPSVGENRLAEEIEDKYCGEGSCDESEVVQCRQGMYVCVYVCMYVILCMYVCMYVCMHVCICMHACMHGCVHDLLIYTEMCTFSAEVSLTSQRNETIPEGTSSAAEPAGVLTSESCSTSAVRHSSNVSPPPNDDFEPVRKKTTW